MLASLPPTRVAPVRLDACGFRMADTGGVRLLQASDIAAALDNHSSLRDLLSGGLDADVLNSRLIFSTGRSGTLLTEACHRCDAVAVKIVADAKGVDVNATDAVSTSDAHDVARVH
jgi:hypothetical protein